MIKNFDKYRERDFIALHRFAAAMIPFSIAQLEKRDWIVYSHEIPAMAYRLADEMMQEAFKIEGRA